MRYVWILLAGVLALVFAATLERAGVDLSTRPLAALLGAESAAIIEQDEREEEFEPELSPAAMQSPVETPESAEWNRKLAELMRSLAAGTIGARADEAAAFFHALDDWMQAASIASHSPLRDARLVLELRVSIVAALIAAGKRSQASAVARGDASAGSVPMERHPDLQGLIPQLQKLAEQRLALGLTDKAIAAADRVWELQLTLLSAEHPDLARLWDEHQRFLVRAGASAETLEEADQIIGLQSARMNQARRDRVDAALAAGDIDDVLASYAAAHCSAEDGGACASVSDYAAKIAMHDPVRAKTFGATYAPRALEHERRQFEWVALFIDALQRDDGAEFLRAGMQAKAREVDTRIHAAANRASDDEIKKLTLTIESRVTERWSIIGARWSVEEALRNVVDRSLRGKRAQLVSLFVEEAHRIERELDAANVRDQRRHDDLWSRRPPTPIVPPPGGTPDEDDSIGIPQPQPPSSPAAYPAAEPSPAPSMAPTAEVDVFYATSRRRTGAEASAEGWQQAERFYGSSSANRLEYGKTRVSIPTPKRRAPGDFPVPAAWEISWTGEERFDEKSHVTLKRVAPLSREAFLSAIAAEPNDSAVIFVHGFYMTFGDAARRTGQLKYDLGLKGPALLYSWAAEKSWLLYERDGNEMHLEIQSQRFARFVRDVRGVLGARRITVIAHSMGARLVADAMTKLAAENPSEEGKLNAAIFAAADVETSKFSSLAPTWPKAARSVVLYASYRDLAMHASQLYNTNEPRRAGYAGTIALAPGLVSVDASAADDEFVEQHSYFADGLLPEVKSVLRLQLSPRQRCVLSPVGSGGQAHWRFGERNCRLGAFRKAVDIAIGAGDPATALEFVRQQLANPETHQKTLVAVEAVLKRMIERATEQREEPTSGSIQLTLAH